MRKLLIEQDKLIDMLSRSADTTYLQNLTDDELMRFYNDSNFLRFFFQLMQLVTKELCNSVYGGFGTASLRYFNQAVAADITGEGRQHCKNMEKVAQGYFKNIWPKDFAWHTELREKFPELMSQIEAPKPVLHDIAITSDTDSCHSSTMIRTSIGTMTIEELFMLGQEMWTEINQTEHRKLENIKVLNWSRKEKLHMTEPLSISRHKVSKERWELVTSSGKKIIVTGDHSLIIFRGKKKVSIKAKDVKLTDRILTVYESTKN